MEQTTDYAQFKSITSNREVDKRHVNRLIIAIRKKNLLHINPIIVNEHLEVIDGQHRLAAAEAAEVPIFYVIDSTIAKQDIAMINSNAKNWSVMDYINYWTIEKKLGFDRLSAFLSEYPEVPVSTALHMLSSDGSRNTRRLSEGYVDTANYDFAKMIAERLKKFFNLVEHTYDRNFVLAVIDISRLDGYDHEQMMKQVQGQPRSVVKCVSKQQYIEMFEELYNYGKSKNKLRFT